MSADFFLKKLTARATSLFFVLFIGGLCILTVYFQSAKKVFVSFRYYYLVQEDASTQAGAVLIYNEGGASYFLEDGKNEWIALALYTRAEDAYGVQEALLNEKSVAVIEKGVDALYFKGKKEKALANTYVNGLKLLDGYIRIVEECIYRLDSGLSQEKAREILGLLNRQLQHCAEGYKKDFPALSMACRRAQNELEDICNSVIMAKDLRYLACEMAQENITMASEFVL